MSKSIAAPDFDLVEFPKPSEVEAGRVEKARKHALIEDVLDDPETAVDALQSLGYVVSPPSEKE